MTTITSPVRLPVNQHNFGLRCWLGHPAHMLQAHRHSEIELNFVQTGTIHYLHRDALVTVTAGQLAVFWAAVPHQLVKSTPDSVYYFITVPLETYLAWQLPQAFTHSLLFGEVMLDAEGENALYNRLLFQRWHADLQTEQTTIALLEIEARLWRLALAQPRCSSSPLHPIPIPVDNKANQMATFMVEHYSEPISVKTIARAVSLNPNYAMQLFKRVFRISLLDYLIQYRVAQAQRLLATTNETILDIALQVGFGSSSNFYAAFKKHCGQPPSVYRQTVRYAG